MADLYTTGVLTGVIEHIPVVDQFLLSNFFPLVQTEESEEIHFDVVKRGRAIAPFVSPLVEGQLMEGAGFSTRTYKPAYIKPKSAINPRRAIKRAPGEQPLGTLSLSQRMDLIVRDTLREHREQIERRLEVMAAEALRTAKLTIEGDKYPRVVLDFGRDAALTVTDLAGATKWDTTTAKPLTNIETWCSLVLRLEGVVITDLLMTLDAWNAFAEHATVKDTLDKLHMMAGQVDTTRPNDVGAIFRGNINGRNMWTYQDWYTDPATGLDTPMFPDGHVVGVSRAVKGVQAFGAITEAVGEEIMLKAVRYSSTSWIDKDPPIRYLLTQSAPLVFPQRPNATFDVKVL